MDKYRVTFYDLIGYLVPGILANATIALYFSFFSDSSLPLEVLYKLNWTWHLLLGYITGHVIQAVANLLFRMDPNSWWLRNKWDPQLKSKILLNLSEKMTGKPDLGFVLSPIGLQLAEAMLESRNHIDKADIFRALQGFLRAITLVLFALALICLLYYLTNKSLALGLNGRLYLVSRSYLGLIGVMMIMSGGITLHRFRKFASHRFRAILIGFIISEGNMGSKFPSQMAQENLQNATST